MWDYRGKQVVIVGLGLTGISCVNFFIARGVIPRVMDSRQHPPGLQQLSANISTDIECYLGGFNEEWLLAANLIVVSPGIALTTPELAAARQAGVEITGDIELFCREAKMPIIAITGSNGKSTVTTLLSEMATAAGWRVGTGGNIGVPALTLLSHSWELVVLELSSFQLELTSTLHAMAATILNVTEDHSDRYPLGLAQYREAKLRIYDNATTCVVNADDPLTLPSRGLPSHDMPSLTLSPHGLPSRSMPPHSIDNRCISFGIDNGDYRLHKQADEVWLQARGEIILKTDMMKLTGQHNYSNALAALALADTLGIPRSCSVAVLKTYRGLAHRFQLVFERNHVRWINDSKATNVGSTVAALNGLQLTGRLYLLLGGEGKSADFSPLARLLQNDKIRVYCFGRDAPQLARLRPESSECTVTMEQAVRKLVPGLQPGDTVLLSPACASLDQFQNFEQRGNEFVRLARELG